MNNHLHPKELSKRLSRLENKIAEMFKKIKTMEKNI